MSNWKFTSSFFLCTFINSPLSHNESLVFLSCILPKYPEIFRLQLFLFLYLWSLHLVLQRNKKKKIVLALFTLLLLWDQNYAQRVQWSNTQNSQQGAVGTILLVRTSRKFGSTESSRPYKRSHQWEGKIKEQVGNCVRYTDHEILVIPWELTWMDRS